MTAKWILIGLIVTAVQAQAADRPSLPLKERDRAHVAHRFDGGPYPLTWRAAKIRRADRCWRACLADASRDFQRCLRVESATDCVPWNDANDRACLRACRLYGGPLVNMAD